MRELHLRGPVVAHFEGQGRLVVPEVPVTGRRADVVAVGAEDLIAIELKLWRWRQAFRQALAYQVWAERAYVCLPLSRALDAWRHRDRFESEGIGLLAVVRDEVRTLLPARPSSRRFPPLTDRVRLMLMDGSESLAGLNGERF